MKLTAHDHIALAPVIREAIGEVYERYVDERRETDGEMTGKMVERVFGILRLYKGVEDEQKAQEENETR
jgi:hypothetical protein